MHSSARAQGTTPCTCHHAVRPPSPPGIPKSSSVQSKGPVRLHVRSVAEVGALFPQRKRHTPSSHPNTALPSGCACGRHGQGLEAWNPGARRSTLLAWFTTRGQRLGGLSGGRRVSDPPDLDSRTPSSSFAQDIGPGFFSAEMSSGEKWPLPPLRSSHADTRTPAEPTVLFKHSSSTPELPLFQRKNAQLNSDSCSLGMKRELKQRQRGTISNYF